MSTTRNEKILVIALAGLTLWVIVLVGMFAPVQAKAPVAAPVYTICYDYMKVPYRIGYGAECIRL